jgi:diguanylate cyclase (GGDEF)-like protein
LHNLYIQEYTLFFFLFLQAQLVGNKLRESLAESTRLSEEKAVLQAAHKRAVQASELDHLTGLYNRLALTERLNELTQNDVPKYDTIGIVLFDLDHFKSVNDTYGHNVGDEILTFIASILHSHSLRTSDFKCRYGGEEFLVVLPGATQERTQRVAEDIRLRIAHSVPYDNDDIQIKITASFGVALFQHANNQSVIDVIHQADLALYEAKSRGRNCVVTDSTI